MSKDRYLIAIKYRQGCADNMLINLYFSQKIQMKSRNKLINVFHHPNIPFYIRFGYTYLDYPTLIIGGWPYYPMSATDSLKEVIKAKEHFITLLLAKHVDSFSLKPVCVRKIDVIPLVKLIEETLSVYEEIIPRVIPQSNDSNKNIIYI